MMYILLGIDGVLTSIAYSQQCRLENKQPNMFGLDWFDPNCTNALRKITDATSAKVIISSSWRNLGIDKLRSLWVANQMPGDITGITPEWILTKEDALQEWIRLHPDDRYVILDDTNYGLSHQIQTIHGIGLTMRDAATAICLLNLPVIQTSNRLKTIMEKILTNNSI